MGREALSPVGAGAGREGGDDDDGSDGSEGTKPGGGRFRLRMPPLPLSLVGSGLEVVVLVAPSRPDKAFGTEQHGWPARTR